MAGYQLDYEVMKELENEFKEMNDGLKTKIKGTAQKIGQDLKSNTERAIPRGTKAKHGVHMADDVQMNVKVTDKKASVTVKGGSKTGSLWFIVDNGHVATNGHFIDGAHFTDKAYNATEVEEPVDALLQEIANAKGNN